jgi:OPA family glycerol-3-phosphate transporter-like MFS transporter
MKRRMFWLMWITYASFYLGRVNLSVAIPGIMAEFGWTRTTVGAVGTALFWAYAVGQLVNGYLGDRLGSKVTVAIGLVASAAFNLTFGWQAALGTMIVVWALNGYFQACGWGPIVKMLANWFPIEERGRAAGRLGTSYILGGAISVMVAGVVVPLGWRWTFLVPALLMSLSAIHWLGKAVNAPPGQPSDYREVLKIDVGEVLGNQRVWRMGFALFCANILRYGFLTWAPTYLFEECGAPVGVAAYKSVVFPIAGALGAVTAGWLSDRVFGARRAPVAGIALALAGLLAMLFPGMPSIVVLALIGFAVFGAHPLIVGATPMDCGTTSMASFATGLIDCIGYIGAGLTGVGTGLLVDNFGWNAGFWFWIGAAFLGAALMGWQTLCER